jgi:hypothetical protein
VNKVLLQKKRLRILSIKVLLIQVWNILNFKISH